MDTAELVGSETAELKARSERPKGGSGGYLWSKSLLVLVWGTRIFITEVVGADT